MLYSNHIVFVCSPYLQLLSIALKYHDTQSCFDSCIARIESSLSEIQKSERKLCDLVNKFKTQLHNPHKSMENVLTDHPLTSLDTDSDLVNLNLAGIHNDGSHAEDILINSCSGSGNLQINVNTDHSPCSNKIDSRLFGAKNLDQIFMLINIQSIIAKKEALWELLDTQTPDIIIGCETWVTPNIFDNKIIPPTYKLYHTDRTDGYGGVLGVRTNTISQQMCTFDLCEINIVKVRLSSGQSLIIMGA